MSKKPPTRFAPDNVHTDYGITNWLHKRKIYDVDAQKAIKYSFCQQKGFDMGKYSHTVKVNNFISNRFPAFCQFAIEYCKENNYQFD